MRLRHRFGLIFGTVLVTLLAVMVLTGRSYWLTRQDQLAIQQRIGPIMEGCRQMERLANEMIEDQFILLKDPAAGPYARAQFAQDRAAFDRAYRAAEGATRSPEGHRLMGEIARMHADALVGQRRLETLVAAGKIDQANREQRALAQPLVTMRDDADRLYTLGIQVVTRMEDEALRRGSLAFSLAFALALAGMAIAAYRWRQTSRDIVEPLRAIQRAAGALAEGHFIQTLHPRASRVTELEALQRDFNAMSARLEAQARGLQDANERLEEQVAQRTAELARLVEELRTLDSLKSDFLANMSHELLTPLNFIVGFGSTLQDELQGPLNPAQQATLGKMLAGADRLTRMVRNTLEYTQLQGGQLAIYPQAVDYAAMLRQLQADMAPHLAARRQTLVLDVPAVLPPVWADADRLRQVLEELLDNACKFSPDGAELRLAAQGGPDVVSTEVADPGEGIPEDALPKLFMPFYQVNSTRTRGYTGMGLGLAIAYHLVIKMGGTMLVSSQPGGGTTIRFTLPRAVKAPLVERPREGHGMNP
jgi:signal transduction histidine kinase